MMTRAAPSDAARALLAAAGLPARWAGAAAFTVLETDLGDGAALVAALLARHVDPARCARLHWASLSPGAPSREALAAALAARDAPRAIAGPLLARWPPAAPGVHRIELDAGRVRISIAIGPARRMLPGWVPRADALLVPVRAGASVDAAVLRAAAAALVEGGVAGIAAARGDAPAPVEATLDALSAAGLACTGLELRFDAPSDAASAAAHARAARAAPARAGAIATWRATRVRGRAAPGTPPPAREALVIGGGLAGGAVGAALARRGWTVARVDAGRDGARAGWAQPVLAQHPSVSPDDAPLSRLTRAATLLAPAVAGADALRPIGRLQCLDEAAAARAARGLPPAWVRAVDAAQASALAGVRLREGGLWLPAACSADPHALLEAWALDGVRVHAGRRVARLERVAGGWRALDGDGVPIAEAPVAVLACGAGELTLHTRPGAAPRPLGAVLGPAGLSRRMGTTTVARPGPSARPGCIVGGDGHAVPIDADRVLLGPAGAPDDDPGHEGPGQDDPDRHDLDRHGPGQHDPDARHRAWRRWAALLCAPGEVPPLSPGPTGTRLSTRDHLPLAGALADPDASAVRGALPALPGLWIVAALGGRGLLWSTLCAELVAAALEHEPAPLERALVRCLAPERFLLRALRRADTPG